MLCLVMAVSSFYFGALMAKGLEGIIAASELAFARVNVAVAAILALCVALIAERNPQAMPVVGGRFHPIGPE